MAPNTVQAKLTIYTGDHKNAGQAMMVFYCFIWKYNRTLIGRLET